jgi:hypothetical protein
VFVEKLVERVTMDSLEVIVVGSLKVDAAGGAKPDAIAVAGSSTRGIVVKKSRTNSSTVVMDVNVFIVSAPYDVEVKGTVTVTFLSTVAGTLVLNRVVNAGFVSVMIRLAPVSVVVMTIPK